MIEVLILKINFFLFQDNIHLKMLKNEILHNTDIDRSIESLSDLKIKSLDQIKMIRERNECIEINFTYQTYVVRR